MLVSAYDQVQGILLCDLSLEICLRRGSTGRIVLSSLIYSTFISLYNPLSATLPNSVSASQIRSILISASLSRESLSAGQFSSRDKLLPTAPRKATYSQYLEAIETSMNTVKRAVFSLDSTFLEPRYF